MRARLFTAPERPAVAKMVEGDKVQLTDVQTLGVGAAWVIARGRAALIQVAPSSPLTMISLPSIEQPGKPVAVQGAPGVYRKPLPVVPVAPKSVQELVQEGVSVRGEPSGQEPHEPEPQDGDQADQPIGVHDTHAPPDAERRARGAA